MAVRHEALTSWPHRSLNRPMAGTSVRMTTSSEHPVPAADPATADMDLQTDKAKATAEAIEADNAALEEAYQSAEAQAEATTEQASQIAQVMEEVVQEQKTP